MGKRALVLIGTKKGAFILEGDAARSAWQLRGPFCENWPINHVNYDASTGTVYAGGGNNWFGPAVWKTTDLGESWTHSSQGLTYGDAGPTLEKVWNVTPGHGSLYAGVDPAGLFRSDDAGETWQHVAGLRAHPSRPEWMPGNGGLICHTIVPHPTDPQQMWVAMSSVGTFYTADGGESWSHRNRGVRADFFPGPPPEFGHCVHKMVMAPGRPDKLYQQNHCGVYRSADGGSTWQEISAGLPSDFGFPMVVHPRQPNSIFVIPLGGAGRYMPDGQAAVWRSRDAGDSWTRLSEGLPQSNAYFGVLREAMAVDSFDELGIYFGSGNGQIFASFDEGDSWSEIAHNLPTVASVEVAVVDG